MRTPNFSHFLICLPAPFRKPQALLTLALFVLLAGCGPKVTVKPPEGVTVPKMIAVLPPDYSGEVARERVDFVRTALVSELRNKGFVVLDDKTVTRTCSTPACPERAALSKSFPVGAFVALNLDSFSKNNFLAGYFNALTGTLAVTKPDGADLFKVEHTESERGGLLFESGQVFQGIISQVKNSGDSAFTDLASRFVRTLIAQFPEATESGGTESNVLSSIPTIQSAEIVRKNDSVLEVCARSSGGSMAYVTLGKVRSSLREVSPGNYCASFPSETITRSAKPIVVEVRNAFGSAARRELSAESSPLPCDLEDRVKVVSTARGSEITISCSSLSGSTGSCGEGQKPCSIVRAVIYRGFSAFGPFIKVAESKTAKWQDRSIKKSESPPTYQVVSIDEKGLRSLPVAAIPQK